MFVYKIQAYDKKDAMDRLTDAVVVTVHAETQEQAFEQAKKAIKRKEYRVSEVHELNPTHRQVVRDNKHHSRLTRQIQAELIKAYDRNTKALILIAKSISGKKK